MVNLEEARFWQASAREWWRMAKEPEYNIDDEHYSRRMEQSYRSSRNAMFYMGITDQDQLYA